MSVIDFHSHILPGIDDGARNLETSLAMLRQVSSQRVDYMIATPHFYASHDRVDAFLNRREDAYNSLKEAVHKESLSDVPQILTGSEVAFFDGISMAELIEDLTIQHTRVLLLEMPFAPWTSQNIHEVEVLVRDREFNVLIAHLERFIWIPGNKKGIRSLLEIPVRIQINSEGLQDWRHRRYLLKMFRSGSAHVLGSDCHGAHHRVPDLLTGREIIKKKCGEELLQRIDRQGEALLFGN